MLPQANRPSRRAHHQSQTTEASAATSNDTVPDSQASQGSKEPHGASKYVQAMRNPDWRRKDGSSHETNRSQTEDLGFDNAGHKSSSSRRTSTEGSHEVGESDTSGSWDLIEFGPPDEGTQLKKSDKLTVGLLNQNQGGAFGSHDLQTTCSHRVPTGLCQLVSHKSLLPDSLVNLTDVRPSMQQPIASQYQDARMLYIQKTNNEGGVPSHDTPKPLADEQSEQFTAALHAVDRTPGKTKRPSQIPIRAPGYIRHARAMPTEGPRRQYFEHLVVNQIGDRHIGTHVSTSPNRQASEQRQTGSTGLTADAKFNKLLERLHRGSRETRSFDEKPHERSEVFSQRALAEPLRPAFSMERATNVEKRRGGFTNSSDSGCEHVEVSGQDAFHPTFNPRAQEFLSFSGKNEASEDEDRHSTFRRSVPIDQLFKMGAGRSQSGEISQKRQSQDFDSISCQDYGTNNLGLLTGGGPFLPLPIPGISGQPGFGLSWVPNPGAIPPVGMSSHIPNFPMGPGQDIPGPAWPGSMTGLPGQAATGPNPLLPMQNWNTNPALAAMSGQQAIGGTHATRPAPVQKPRRPDPSNQQAYEAWIEWRKANEPGYALECKLRQQRRSQKHAATAPKPKIDGPPKLEAQAEVVVSA